MIFPNSIFSRRWTSIVVALSLCGSLVNGVGAAELVSAERVVTVRHQMELLNGIPEIQLDEKRGSGLSIIKKLYDLDGPDFLTLRKLLSQAPVRSSLNPSTRVVLAGIISQRWDTFAICGNLWLAGLRSPNQELREKSRRKLVCFIQPAHVPPLIELLAVKGPNTAAYEVLQEVTGKNFPPDVKAWRAWYKKVHSVDVVGHLLADTKEQVESHAIAGFDQDKLWYAPSGITDVQAVIAKRSPKEDETLNAWRAWTAKDVKAYVDAWAIVKPIVERISHQPDPRVSHYFEALVKDPGYGDYASVVLGWRASATSLPVLQTAYEENPTVGRALARGALGDKTALRDLLKIVDRHPNPLAFALLDDDAREDVKTLHSVGVVPAEQAFELLCHKSFDFESASTKKQKTKALKEATRWYKENVDRLALDRRRGYFNTTN